MSVVKSAAPIIAIVVLIAIVGIGGLALANNRTSPEVPASEATISVEATPTSAATPSAPASSSRPAPAPPISHQPYDDDDWDD